MSSLLCFQSKDPSSFSVSFLDFWLFLWLFFELSPAGPQLSGGPRTGLDTVLHGTRVTLAWAQTVLLPGHPTVVFVLLRVFFGSIMTLFVLSCDWFSSYVVSSRFSWCSSVLPRWLFH